MNLLSLSMSRIEELLGGTQFDGQALDGNGKVREGTFVLSGPLAYFNEKSGTLAGLTESDATLNPEFLNFRILKPRPSAHSSMPRVILLQVFLSMQPLEMRSKLPQLKILL